MYHGQHQTVGQGEDDRQGTQGIHTHFAVEGPGQPGNQYVHREEKARAQQTAGNPDLDLIVVQRGKPHIVEGGHHQLDNGDHSLPLDYDEVAVTRRYYRSGESEFFINKKPVRLKDVHELLMDTGLGREGYSIIGQGRIDEILSVKSADRREIFEEAAGISRFRHRKEEAERKLERTDENLVRINDKISELELQVEPLRAQSEKAKNI